MKNQKPQTERSQEKFPKTRTFPEGWDMSSHEASMQDSSQASDSSHHSAGEQEAQSPRSHEKFPKTTTMPSGWIF